MTLIDDDASALGEADPPSTNDVRLVGTLSQPMEIKDLPSGDQLGKWQLVVARPRRADPVDAEAAGPGVSGARRRQTHDTIECTSFDPELIERMRRVAPRASLEVHGALRRRFYGPQGAKQSSYSVEVFAISVRSAPAGVETAEPGDPTATADTDGSADLTAAG